MGAISDRERNYVIWQNRAIRFYLGARLLYRRELYAPAAYSAAIAIELLLKATLIYWEASFKSLEAGHAIAQLARMVRNKARNAKAFSVPGYFYREKRYLETSRYPTDGKGLVVPSSFLGDLDAVIADLVLLVPFQHNTELRRTINSKSRSELDVLRAQNAQMRRLREALGRN